MSESSYGKSAQRVRWRKGKVRSLHCSIRNLRKQFNKLTKELPTTWRAVRECVGDLFEHYFKYTVSAKNLQVVQLPVSFYECAHPIAGTGRRELLCHHRIDVAMNLRLCLAGKIAHIKRRPREVSGKLSTNCFGQTTRCIGESIRISRKYVCQICPFFRQQFRNKHNLAFGHYKTSRHAAHTTLVFGLQYQMPVFIFVDVFVFGYTFARMGALGNIDSR